MPKSYPIALPDFSTESTNTSMSSTEVSTFAVLYGLLLAGVLPRPKRPLATLAIYWHFVDIVWVLVLTVVYILPRFL